MELEPVEAVGLLRHMGENSGHRTTFTFKLRASGRGEAAETAADFLLAQHCGDLQIATPTILGALKQQLYDTNGVSESLFNALMAVHLEEFPPPPDQEAIIEYNKTVTEPLDAMTKFFPPGTSEASGEDSDVGEKEDEKPGVELAEAPIAPGVRARSPPPAFKPPRGGETHHPSPALSTTSAKRSGSPTLGPSNKRPSNKHSLADAICRDIERHLMVGNFSSTVSTVSEGSESQCLSGYEEVFVRALTDRCSTDKDFSCATLGVVQSRKFITTDDGGETTVAQLAKMMGMNIPGAE